MKKEMPPENCECSCHEGRMTSGKTCGACTSWHLSVLRHTVAKFLGNWHRVEIVEAGGLLQQKDLYGTLPGHCLGT